MRALVKRCCLSGGGPVAEGREIRSRQTVLPLIKPPLAGLRPSSSSSLSWLELESVKRNWRRTIARPRGWPPRDGGAKSGTGGKNGRAGGSAQGPAGVWRPAALIEIHLALVVSIQHPIDVLHLAGRLDQAEAQPAAWNTGMPRPGSAHCRWHKTVAVRGCRTRAIPHSAEAGKHSEHSPATKAWISAGQQPC